MNRFQKLNLLVCFFLFGFLVTGCQSKNENEGKSELKTQSISQHKSQTIDTIVIEGMQFVPNNLEVKKGDKVVWINKDIVEHDVTDVENPSNTSGNIEVGEVFQMKIERVFSYKCSIHPTMKAQIKIKK